MPKLISFDKHRWRHIQASLRDTGILLREFRTPLFWFSFAVIGGGLLYEFLARLLGEPVDSLAEAIYIVLTVTFLQPPNRNFPHHFALQLFHFVMPIIGLIVLAQGLADFGSLFFNRKSRNKEWEMAVASTFNDHIILVGLGHLGYRIALKLHEMGENLVVIEFNAEADTINVIKQMGIPVIHDDATRPAVLEASNVKTARAIIMASQNDAMNLQIALKARSLNPKIQVVVRIFDDDFAHALQEQFGFIALSATEMAAPVFAAAAAGVDVTNPISVEGQLLSLARLTINQIAPFATKTVGYVEDNYHLNIVLHRRDGESEMHPTDNTRLQPGDVIAILGSPDMLNQILHENGQ
ncbi:MAG TPA: NAD-binding protein [Anaerolineales bacterium]|nr:NAD-binding protein [Anaerolineales bacterium]HNA89753.1 NAD-binding protein [Anaerolineales bacterium]HNB34906.1 NAD-binding protein [Anaerolineales bacterium]HNC09652.1 NAD-binding protein [Anaerolineales bacterium]